MHKYEFKRGHPFFHESSDRYNGYLFALNSVVEKVAEKVASSGNPNRARSVVKSIIDKLQLNRSATIDRNQFLQNACELTVAGYLCRLKGASEFEYEYVVNGKKDIDSSIVFRGTRVNFEIKCPNPKPERTADHNDALILRTYGRIANFVQLRNDIRALAEMGDFSSCVPVPGSDYNVRDALADSSLKFRQESRNDELNCVVICGDDADSLQHYYHCLYGAGGLLTTDSWDNSNKFENIDAVILSNLRHRHDNYVESCSLSNPWELEHAFNLILENSLRNRELPANLGNLLSVIHNYNQPFNDYVVPGEAPDDVLHGIKLVYFINTIVPHLNNGLF